MSIISVDFENKNIEFVDNGLSSREIILEEVKNKKHKLEEIVELKKAFDLSNSELSEALSLNKNSHKYNREENVLSIKRFSKYTEEEFISNFKNMSFDEFLFESLKSDIPSSKLNEILGL
tara:strand:- start:21312 stop:21671 length:360 start_codon:yes stop_codon:yes gene_type:complete